MKILIYPGSFDPFHSGHLQTFRNADKIKFNKTIFLIQPNIFKQNGMFTVNYRKTLMQNMLNEKNIQYRIDVAESSYFCDQLERISLEYLEYCDFYLLIGDDTLDTIDKWKNFKQLKGKLHFIIQMRKYQYHKIIKLIEKLGINNSSIIIGHSHNQSSTTIRQNIHQFVIQESRKK